jgi:hypothetical protein
MCIAGAMAKAVYTPKHEKIDTYDRNLFKTLDGVSDLTGIAVQYVINDSINNLDTIADHCKRFCIQVSDTFKCHTYVFFLPHQKHKHLNKSKKYNELNNELAETEYLFFFTRDVNYILFINALKSKK